MHKNLTKYLKIGVVLKRTNLSSLKQNINNSTFFKLVAFLKENTHYRPKKDHF